MAGAGPAGEEVAALGRPSGLSEIAAGYGVGAGLSEAEVRASEDSLGRFRRSPLHRLSRSDRQTQCGHRSKISLDGGGEGSSGDAERRPRTRELDDRSEGRVREIDRKSYAFGSRGPGRALRSLLQREGFGKGPGVGLGLRKPAVLLHEADEIA
jgi:hypothetical protein